MRFFLIALLAIVILVGIANHQAHGSVRSDAYQIQGYWATP